MVAGFFIGTEVEELKKKGRPAYCKCPCRHPPRYSANSTTDIKASRSIVNYAAPNIKPTLSDAQPPISDLAAELRLPANGVSIISELPKIGRPLLTSRPRFPLQGFYFFNVILSSHLYPFKYQHFTNDIDFVTRLWLFCHAYCPMTFP